MTAATKAATNTAEWTAGWRSSDCSSGEEDVAESLAESVISEFNAAMGKLNEVATTRQVSPLMFQLKTSRDEAKEHEKETCIDKTTEACSLVCEIIAQKAAQELLKSCFIPNTKADYGDLQAYTAAKTRNVKTQILSLHAYRYPARMPLRIHKPLAKLTSQQIKCARAHPRECSPGSLVEKPRSHWVRLLPAKLDHFLNFVNWSYFYQDVAFGMRKLKRQSGEILTMPNIIRKVTRATMIRQYQQFCEEEHEPLSLASLFCVLQLWEASQQKSLSGLDNKAAKGSAVFARLQQIVEETCR